MSAAIGRLERVLLRDLWKHEEHGFSVWLQDNTDALGAAVGFTLNEPQREVYVGTFCVDLVAESEGGDRVIIENQLEATDHDHLGKVLTYLTNLDAKIAIWVAKDARPEHIKAVSWLNETTPDDVAFYLVRLDAYRIGTSPPAPLFTVIVGPSAEAKGFGQQRKALAERHILRRQFWEGLLQHAKSQGIQLHAGRSPSTDMWLGAGAGRSGLAFNYLVWRKDRTGVELSIDTGNTEENKRLFDALAAKRDSVDKSFGGPLSWERLDEKQASRIRHTLSTGGLDAGEPSWAGQWTQMADAMQRLAKALKPHLATA